MTELTHSESSAPQLCPMLACPVWPGGPAETGTLMLHPDWPEGTYSERKKGRLSREICLYIMSSFNVGSYSIEIELGRDKL